MIYRGFKTSQVIGNGISEPSTVCQYVFFWGDFFLQILPSQITMKNQHRLGNIFIFSNHLRQIQVCEFCLSDNLKFEERLLPNSKATQYLQEVSLGQSAVFLIARPSCTKWTWMMDLHYPLLECFSRNQYMWVVVWVLEILVISICTPTSLEKRG